MGFIYSFMNSNSPAICFVWNHQYFEKLVKKPNIFELTPEMLGLGT